MVKRIIVPALLLLAIAAGRDAAGEEKTAKKRKIGQIEWYLDYDEALQVASEKQRPLWLHFGEHPG